MILGATSSVVEQIVETEQERTFWEVVRHHERPPFYDAKEGVGNRLNKAARVVYEERLTPNSDGSYTVEGSQGHTYRVREHCSCPDSTYRKERGPCYHEIAVVLYVEWQRRLRPVAPVVLGTLRAGTAPLPPVPDDDTLGNGYPVDDETLPLPLPPVTVDERLAAAATDAQTRAKALDAVPYDGQSPTLADRQRNYTQASLPPTAEDTDPQYLTPHTPQEDRMADDAYIPEPDDLPPVTVEEPPAPTPLRIPREYTVNIKGKTHVLYTGLVIAARHDGLVSLSADWTYNDAELSLAHAVCTFADGRRYEESGDASPANVSKGISPHFRRVALTRAKARCLRDALGIAECSVEEMEDDGGKRETPDMTRQPSPLHPMAELRQRIWKIVQAKAPEVKNREAVEAYIQEHTGMALHPDLYGAILSRLEGHA